MGACKVVSQPQTVKILMLLCYEHRLNDWWEEEDPICWRFEL